jgi:hypothetical protein
MRRSHEFHNNAVTSTSGISLGSAISIDMYVVFQNS